MVNLLKNSTAFALALFFSHQVSAAENLKFTGTLVVPPICTVGADKNGSQIQVEFPGRMPISKIDGVNFMKSFDYFIECTAGTPGLELDLTLSGVSGTGYDGGGVIKTNLGDLGIKVYYDIGGGKKEFTLDTALPVDPANKPILWAVPVNKIGGTLIEGNFEAIATLKAEYK